MTEADRAKWDRLHAEAGGPSAAPGWLENLVLPQAGRALDVAAGRGRIARWLAERGLDVTAVDVSEVGLARIAHPRVRTVVLDLDEAPALPGAPYDVITMFAFRAPELGPRLRDALAPGGWLVVEHPTTVNLERHARPSRRWLAEPGEVRRLAAGLTVERYDEAWRDVPHSQHTARLVARR